MSAPFANGATLADFAQDKCWCAWQEEPTDAGTLTKVPHGLHGRASSTDQTTWLTRAEAEKVAGRLKNKPKGVGIFLGRDQDLPPGFARVGFDFDSCRDPVTEAIAPWAWKLIMALDSYAEISPSGTGIKVYALIREADLFAIRRVINATGWGRSWKMKTGQGHPPGIEVYLRDRYFAVTDDMVPVLPEALRVLNVAEFEALVVAANAWIAGSDGGGSGGDRPRDDTRSGEAMRIGKRVRQAGGSYEEMCDQIANDPVTGSWFHENGITNGERGLKRVWHKTGPVPDRVWEIAGEIKRAGGSYDDFIQRVRQDPGTEEWHRYTDREQHEKAWATTPEPMPGGGNRQSRVDEITLDALQREVIEPMRWIVPEYLPEGLTVFAGKPKIGKSWFMLNVALGVATGAGVFGKAVDQGDVLYCGLEDGKRRMQARVAKLISAGTVWPACFTFRYRLAPLDQGGMATLEQWLIAHPKGRLVVIDVLGKTRSQKQKNEEPYQYDYRLLSSLQELAIRYRVAIVVVHHVRKADAEDVLDTISGTTGIAGACDTALVLGRTKHGLRFSGRGRDIEDIDKVADFDFDTGIWAILGEYDEAVPNSEMSIIKQAILNLLARTPASLMPMQIAGYLKKSQASVRLALFRMRNTQPASIKRLADGSYETA
jgi:hypothetical protein